MMNLFKFLALYTFASITTVQAQHTPPSFQCQVLASNEIRSLRVVSDTVYEGLVRVEYILHAGEIFSSPYTRYQLETTSQYQTYSLPIFQDPMSNTQISTLQILLPSGEGRLIRNFWNSTSTQFLALTQCFY